MEIGFSILTLVMMIGMILFTLISILVPIIIGVFIYKDAKLHNMNAAMWTLIAILAPSFIGVIIYLIIRSDKPMNHCGICGSPIKKDYIRCPQCGTPLKKICNTCNQVLEDNWSICPYCGTSHVATQPTNVPVILAPEKSIGKIMIPIILILLFLVIVLGSILIIAMF